MRNNPPKKEVLLKDSKDKEEYKFSYQSGKFGPAPEDLMN